MQHYYNKYPDWSEIHKTIALVNEIGNNNITDPVKIDEDILKIGNAYKNLNTGNSWNKFKVGTGINYRGINNWYDNYPTQSTFTPKSDIPWKFYQYNNPSTVKPPQKFNPYGDYHNKPPSNNFAARNTNDDYNKNRRSKWDFVSTFVAIVCSVIFGVLFLVVFIFACKKYFNKKRQYGSYFGE